MSTNRSEEFLVSLLRELCKLPQETEWLEFKENMVEAQEIGEYISALANSATLAGKANAYLIWGVSDVDHLIVGTKFSPQRMKLGNEELENWLLRLLTPKIHFSFHEVGVEGVKIVILEIERTLSNPVQFAGVEYVRIGSYKKKLRDFPERERSLWRIFDRVPFESSVAAEHLTERDVVSLLDFPQYFDLLDRPLPDSNRKIIEALQSDHLVNSTAAGRWDITNLGAVLFAKRINQFPSLARKSLRVIQYRGTDRIDTLKEQPGTRGYGTGFEGLISYVNTLLPSSEVIRKALRGESATFPELAIRELVANAMIHQDFSIAGAGPMVEIFGDRVEITNPGAPLVKTERFVDSPPRSRNEALASLMRRIGVCEERGSGWDKVVFLTEFHQLPAPLTESINENTRVVLFAHRSLNRMDKDDRVRALYLHSCLRYVNRERMTNTSVRERFGIEPHNTATASRLIREAVESGRIVPYDRSAAPKLMRYIPFWAASEASNT
jgi:predicted HTH transcriptional regulator